MINHYVKWVCPEKSCQFENNDDIDDELGPFWTLICSACGQTYDMADIKYQETTSI
jgi:hypothetical protein